MQHLRPIQAFHRGIVPVSAILFGDRTRLLRAWTPGCKVFRLREEWLLCLPRPRTMPADAVPGLPLIEQGGCLTGAPLTEAELKTLAPPARSVLLVVGGWTSTSVLDAEVDPSGWLDLSAFQALALEPLGAPPPTLVRYALPAPPDLRKALKAGAPPSELEQVLAALEQAQRKPAAPQAPSRFWSWLQAKLTPTPLPAPSGGRSNLPARPPSPPSPMMAKLWELTTRFVVRSQLAPFLGRRQARYVHEMMDLFRGERLEDALRRAIPLSSLQGGSGLPSRPALGVPSARQDLTISSHSGPASSSLIMAPDLFAELKTLYRRAHEKLLAEGKIEEAAFVLLELLQETGEGLEFLEKHGRYQLAAELAESRGQPAALALRLWLQAGDLRRALLIAQRSGAFAEAVAHLERTNPPVAQKLRLLWARTLAASGDFPGAVQALWPVETQRENAISWIDRAIEAGGPSGARMLVRKLSLEAATYGELRGQALEWLEAGEPELATALGNEIASGASTPELKALARAVLRSGAASALAAPASKALVERLIQFSGDSALGIDLQKLELAPAAPPVLEWTIQASDVGSLPIQDAARLPSGLWLVALGEAGVRLLSASGKLKAHFDLPAHRLVLADHGTRALTLASRGNAWSLGRIDLSSWKSERWCLAQMVCFAPDYDGLLWFVGMDGGTVGAVDPLANRFEALWQVREENAAVLSLQRSEKHLSALLFLQNRAEVWTYELPSLTLRSRKPLPLDPRGAPVGLSAEGKVAAYQLPYKLGSPHLYFAWDGSVQRGASLQEMGEFAAEPLLSSRWAALPFQEAKTGRFTVHVLEISTAQTRAVLHLWGSEKPHLRLRHDTLLLTDARGRLLAYDCDRQAILANLRL